MVATNIGGADVVEDVGAAVGDAVGGGQRCSAMSSVTSSSVLVGVSSLTSSSVVVGVSSVTSSSVLMGVSSVTSSWVLVEAQ